MSSQKLREMALLLLIFIVGVAFRLWFINLAPQPFGWDQYEYETYAAKMWKQGMLASHSYRSYPYPLFLTLVYKLAGWGNHGAIFYFQAVLDSLTGLLVYWILKKITLGAYRGSFFDSSRQGPDRLTCHQRFSAKAVTGLEKTHRAVSELSMVAWLGLLLYAFNPFTAGYVGVLLTEVLSAFTITATLTAGIWFLQKPNLIKGLLVGLFAGLAAETRNAAFAWAVIPLGLLVLAQLPDLKKIKFRQLLVKAYLGIAVGVFLTLIYPLYVNWRDYREINFTTVDSIFAREFFNGAILKRLPPFTYVYPPQVQRMYGEYYSEYDPGRTSSQRKAMAAKYFNMALVIAKAEPIDYLRVRLDKMWYVWQKENLFFYTEPNYEKHKMYTYMLNLLILFLAAVGLGTEERALRSACRVLASSRSRSFSFPSGLFCQGRDDAAKHHASLGACRLSLVICRYGFLVILGTILYGTFTFSITHAEYRLTIPFYPLLIIAGTLGIKKIISGFV